jgi:cytochrome oxidase Cu insertion factor (SCO1/SenC/PrrC family)
MRGARVLTAFGTAVAVAALAASAPAAPEASSKAEPEISHTSLKVGDEAPDFTLPDTNFKPVTLSSFRGKKDVILAFYVMAFTGG